MPQHRYLLTEDKIPTRWYNIAADLPTPLPPPLAPDGSPLLPEMMTPIFPMELILQEVSQDRWIAIPDPVREIYALWRPTPLHRALGFERALGTDCKIFYKWEGSSPVGSHKPNTSVPQAYYNAEAGRAAPGHRDRCRTVGLLAGARLPAVRPRVQGVHGAGQLRHKPYRRVMIETWGGECVASPSPETNAGRAILAEHPDSTGSLGIAISEAVEDAATREDTNYALGSVLNHVLLHQTVVGQEAIEQMQLAGAQPDVVVGCVGGGSNFAGLAFPFLAQKFAGAEIKVVAAEPASCPTLTRGVYGYDFGDTAGMTPLLPMHSLGHSFVPPSIHSGGLRYHGMAPLVSHLVHTGLVEARAYRQLECFEQAVAFGRAEGIIPAPEASHAIRGVVDEVERARQEGVSKTILFNLCGHGNFDMAAYQQYLAGEMVDSEFSQDELDHATAELAAMPALPA